MTAQCALDRLYQYYLEIRAAIAGYDTQYERNKFRLQGFISYTLDHYTETFRRLMNTIVIDNCVSSKKISLKMCMVHYSFLTRDHSAEEKLAVEYLDSRTNTECMNNVYEELCSQDYKQMLQCVSGLRVIHRELLRIFNENDLLNIELCA